MTDIEKDDYFHIYNIKNNINVDNSINILTDRHIGIVSKNAYTYSAATGIAPAELIQDAKLVVWKAAESFDENKNSLFSSYLYNSSRFHFLNMTKAAAKTYNQEMTDPQTLQFIETPAQDEDRNKAKKQELLDYITFLAESCSDERIKFIIKMRYFSDKRERNFKSIGRLLGITGQATKNIHSNFLRLVKNKLQAKDSLDFI